jgi:uncharacterized protein
MISVLITVLAAMLHPNGLGATPPDRRPLPEPLGYVTDHAAILDPEWKARIRSVCQDLERKTGVEMVVVTVNTVRPYAAAFDYASAIYQKWGVGSAQQEHGVLVLAAIEERQAAVTVGRSLMPILTSSVIEEIGRQYVEPPFRVGHYGEGLYRATVALASSLQDIRVGSPPRPHLRWLALSLTIFTGLGAVAFLWWISRPDLRHPFLRIHRGQYWSSGQGGFGGNFGGFGGGTSGEGLK